MINFDKYIIADVFDCFLVDNNGETIMAEEDNSDVTFSMKTDVKEIKCGQGNKTACILRSKQAPEITMTSPKMNLQGLARNLGQDIVTGKAEGITKAIKVRVDATMKHTLARVPKDPTKLQLSKNGNALTITTDYTYSEGVITFVEGGQVSANDVVIIVPYMFETNDKASKIKIDATSFSEGAMLILETFAINKNDKKQGTLYFKMYNAIADGTIDFATKSERDASENKITYKCVASDDDSYGEIVFVPEEA